MHGTLPTRKGRFRSDPPISHYTGEPRRIKIMPSDVELFRMLAFDFHYLSPTDIAPLWGRSYAATKHRTALLVRAGYLRLSPEQEHNSKHYFRGPLFYAIGDKGLRVLAEHQYEPIKRPSPVNLKHQVMIDQIMTSIQIGVKENPHLSITRWNDVLKSPKIPEATRNSKSAYVQLSDDKDGKSRFLRADGLPFVIARTFGDKTEYMFFIGIEADCHTESLPVIREKFKGYVELLRDKLYRKHFGANSFFVIVAAPSEPRKRALMQAWEAVTEGCKAFRSSMLFVDHPLFTSSHAVQKPTGRMVTEKLERVGYPAIILSKQETVSA